MVIKDCAGERTTIARNEHMSSRNYNNDCLNVPNWPTTRDENVGVDELEVLLNPRPVRYLELHGLGHSVSR